MTNSQGDDPADALERLAEQAGGQGREIPDSGEAAHPPQREQEQPPEPPKESLLKKTLMEIQQIQGYKPISTGLDPDRFPPKYNSAYGGLHGVLLVSLVQARNYGNVAGFFGYESEAGFTSDHYQTVEPKIIAAARERHLGIRLMHKGNQLLVNATQRCELTDVSLSEAVQQIAAELGSSDKIDPLIYDIGKIMVEGTNVTARIMEAKKAYYLMISVLGSTQKS